MVNAYVSILTTDNYVFGALVLWKSLMDTKPKHPFYLLITPNLSAETLKLLETSGVSLIKIDPIKNPILDNKNDRRYYNYSKLNMWSLVQFEKIVYLDADMVVLHNIDELFEKPNMSSTNSGGWLPDKKDWKQLNSGLVVLEPSMLVFDDMKSKVGKIEKEKGKGDQAFIHQYYSDWPDRKDLHLPHIYNVFDCHLRGYKKHHGYYVDENVREDNKGYDEKRVKIIHFIGQHKPWHLVEEIKKKKEVDDEWAAKRIWVRYYRELKALLRTKIGMSETSSNVGGTA